MLRRDTLMNACLAGLCAVTAHAALADTSTAALAEQVSALQKKVDALEAGPLTGLAITGYVDPTYIANQDQHLGSFFFANKAAPYAYYQSTFGDVYLDFKKTFADNSNVEIQLMPTRGYGAASGSIVNAAILTVPVGSAGTFIAGQIPAWDGYETQISPTMLTVTHNLLYDFSEPGYFTGAGGTYTAGPFLAQALVANPWNTSYNTSYRAPTLEYRLSMTPSKVLSYGLFGTIGKMPTVAAAGVPPETVRVYNDFDGTLTTGPVTVNWQFDYGRQDQGAYNGGTAQWYGASLLGNYRFVAPFGATLRYDYLNDKKNGGHVASADNLDGFITSPTNPGVGTARQALTGALLFYPTRETIFKVEYRHDIASLAAFTDTKTGALKKTNNTIAAQVVYSF